MTEMFDDTTDPPITEAEWPDEPPEPPRRAAKWDGRPFPGRCTWTHPTTGQQCDNQAISSFGYWDGGAPGAGRWVQSGACLDHSGSTA